MDKNNYIAMQKGQYDHEAAKWTVDNRDPIVGSFDKHNNWGDYSILFEGMENTKDKVCLDFGCGPGRNLVKYHDVFKRIDGVDISQLNLDNAKIWLEHNNIASESKLFHCNGQDLSCIESDSYDVIMSTICMQHIACYDIRYHYWEEFYRCLKDGGKITFQMGYGSNHPYSVDYYTNQYSAKYTNGACDTRVENPDQLKNDLEKIGFTDFEFKITPVGPGDGHSNWIFFKATK